MPVDGSAVGTSCFVFHKSFLRCALRPSARQIGAPIRARPTVLGPAPGGLGGRAVQQSDAGRAARARVLRELRAAGTPAAHAHAAGGRNFSPGPNRAVRQPALQ
jgi:hypothetical protein